VKESVISEIGFGIPAFIFPARYQSSVEKTLIATNGDQVAIRMCPREFNRSRGDVGAVFGKLHHIRPSMEPKEFLSRFHFYFCRLVKLIPSCIWRVAACTTGSNA